jgi:hypothetical protein
MSVVRNADSGTRNDDSSTIDLMKGVVDLNNL